MRVPARLPFPLPFLAIALTACVSYHASPIDPVSLAADAAVPPPGPMTWEAAVRFALEHNPDLLALRARAAAVSPPAGEPIEAEAGTDNARMREAMVTFDALSVLGLGSRGADVALARARRCEAWRKHHEKAREVAAALAETYLLAEGLDALAALAPPETAADGAAYVRAGLEPAAAEKAAKATDERRRHEVLVLSAERDGNGVGMMRLLGARADARVRPSPVTASVPSLEIPTDARERALWMRADVQRALASYEVADRELAKAVADQFPGLILSPGVGNDPLAFFGHVGVRLPFGASAVAHAAESAREASRREAQAVVLDALKDSEQAGLDWGAARSRLAAARSAAEAGDALLKASKARLQASGGSYLEVVLSADVAIDGRRELREATAEEVRARVAYAKAEGWPGPDLIEEASR